MYRRTLFGRRCTAARGLVFAEALEQRAMLSAVAAAAPAAIEANITGHVFVDRDADGMRDADETSAPAALAFVDLDRDGVIADSEPTAAVDNAGGFVLVVPGPGTYQVRVQFPARYTQSTPAQGYAEVTVEPGQVADAGDFGAFTSGVVTGRLFEDEAADGAFSTGDGLLRGAAVYADVNLNGARDAGEPFATAEAQASYRLELPAGAYTLRAELPEGFVGSRPSTGSYPLNITDGATVTARDFGAYAPAVAEGYVFQDANANQRFDAGDRYLVGRRLWVDLDRDGVRDANEPTAISRLRGRFWFRLKPGTYSIRQEMPAGWTVTNGTAWVVTLTSGQHTRPQALGSNARGRISGVVFDDGDGDGVRDPGEALVGEGTAYLDANNNGVLDAGERTAQPIDGYWFDNLSVGTYTVRFNPTTGWTQSAPAGGAPLVLTVQANKTTSGNFGVAYVPVPDSITGAVFDDANRNGARDAGEEGIPYRAVYIDANDNGQQDTGEKYVVSGTGGRYRFMGLTPGTYRLRQSVPTYYAPTLPAANGARTVTLGAGDIVTGQDFGTVNTPYPGRIFGALYEDANGNGIADDGEPRLQGYIVYLDLNNDGVFQFNEVNSSATTDAFGNYYIQPPYGTGVPVTVRVIVPDGYRAASPASGSYVVDTPGLPGPSGGTLLNFGVARAGTWVTGTVFNDLDRDGVRDANEPGLADHTVYADENNNFRYDAGERYAATGADGSYTIRTLPAGSMKVRLDSRGDVVQTSPGGDGAYAVTAGSAYQLLDDRDFGLDASAPAGSISGTVYYDVDHDGQKDAGDPGMVNWVVYLDADGDHVADADERSTMTNQFNGGYRFGDLPAGTYTVRADVPSSFNQTAPTSNTGQTVTLAAGQAVLGADFGVKERTDFTGAIQGRLFNDADADGVKDSGEQALAGWRVFIDDDRDGVFDAWERSAVTDSTGLYQLGNVARGSHRVRPVVQSGWRVSSPVPAYRDISMDIDRGVTADFLLTQKVRISGFVFNDVDGDGTKDSGEAGLSGWKVFLDADNDGVLDSGEKNVLTDSAGGYVFDNLPAGTYRVRVVQQAGWTRTSPSGGSYGVTLASGETSGGRNFGQRG